MLLHSTLSICLQCCTSSAHLPLLHLSAAAPTQLPLSSHSAPSPLSCSKKAAAAPPFKGHTDWCQPNSFQLAVEPLPQNVDKLNKGQNFSGFAFPLHNLSKPGVYQLYHWFQVDSEWFDSVKCKYIIWCHQASIWIIGIQKFQPLSLGIWKISYLNYLLSFDYHFTYLTLVMLLSPVTCDSAARGQAMLCHGLPYNI